MKSYSKDDANLGKVLEKKNDRYSSHLNEAFTDVRAAAILLSVEHCESLPACLKGLSPPARACAADALDNKMAPMTSHECTLHFDSNR